MFETTMTGEQGAYYYSTAKKPSEYTALYSVKGPDWYVRNSKVERFAKAFNGERFQGLPFVRLTLTYRSIVTSNKK